MTSEEQLRELGLFSLEKADGRPHHSLQDLILGRLILDLILGRISSWQGWSSIGTGSPGKWWDPHPWRYLGDMGT